MFMLSGRHCGAHSARAQHASRHCAPRCAGSRADRSAQRRAPIAAGSLDQARRPVGQFHAESSVMRALVQQASLRLLRGSANSPMRQVQVDTSLPAIDLPAAAARGVLRSNSNMSARRRDDAADFSARVMFQTTEHLHRQQWELSKRSDSRFSEIEPHERPLPRCIWPLVPSCLGNAVSTATPSTAPFFASARPSPSPLPLLSAAWIQLPCGPAVLFSFGSAVRCCQSNSEQSNHAAAAVSSVFATDLKPAAD